MAFGLCLAGSHFYFLRSCLAWAWNSPALGTARSQTPADRGAVPQAVGRFDSARPMARCRSLACHTAWRGESQRYACHEALSAGDDHPTEVWPTVCLTAPFLDDQAEYRLSSSNALPFSFLSPSYQTCLLSLSFSFHVFPFHKSRSLDHPTVSFVQSLSNILYPVFPLLHPPFSSLLYPPTRSGWMHLVYSRLNRTAGLVDTFSVVSSRTAREKWHVQLRLPQQHLGCPGNWWPKALSILRTGINALQMCGR